MDVGGLEESVEHSSQDSIITGATDIVEKERLGVNISQHEESKLQGETSENSPTQESNHSAHILVHELQGLQGIPISGGDGVASATSDGVVVEDVAQTQHKQNLQEYQSVVLQGFLTSTGELVHVVQPNGMSTPSTNSAPQLYPAPYPHQQVVHPDLYRLIKMFPDFSTKTLHRIFVLCHGDLKRSLDQALFARQFRQLDCGPYNPVAPSSVSGPSGPHFQHVPYRVPTRTSYIQMFPDVPQTEVFGTIQGAPRLPQAAPQPILLYQQHDLNAKQDSELVQIKLDNIPVTLNGDCGMPLADGGMVQQDFVLGTGDELNDKDVLGLETARTKCHHSPDVDAANLEPAAGAAGETGAQLVN